MFVVETAGRESSFIQGFSATCLHCMESKECWTMVSKALIPKTESLVNSQGQPLWADEHLRHVGRCL